MISIVDFRYQFSDSIFMLLDGNGFDIDRGGVSCNWKSIKCYLNIINKMDSDDYEEQFYRDIEELLLVATETNQFRIKPIYPSELDGRESRYMNEVFSPARNDENTRGSFSFGAFQGSKSDFDDIKSKIKIAYDFLECEFPDYYQELTSYIEEILIVGPAADGGIRSGSSINAFGCIINRPSGSGDVLQFIEDLIHETIHHRIYVQQIHDQILNTNNKNFYPAPFREDKIYRPLSTQYHSANVCGHVAIVMKKISDEKLFENVGTYNPSEKYLEMYEWHRSCVEILNKNASLTSIGSEILKNTIDMVNSRFQ